MSMRFQHQEFNLADNKEGMNRDEIIIFFFKMEIILITIN